jgi:hypothetical protein
MAMQLMLPTSFHNSTRRWTCLEHAPLINSGLSHNCQFSLGINLVIFHFISIWEGTKKAIRKCKFLFRNFLWAGGDQCLKTRVNWFYCCTNKDIGGLGLINPKKAMDTLLFKWVIRALKLGNSNFKLLLCFKLTMCKSSKHMKWGPNMNWALFENHNPSPKTKVWGSQRLGSGWLKSSTSPHRKWWSHKESKHRVGL